MTEKVALITGASRGLGREIAQGLAKDGYTLALVARSADSLNAVLDEINRLDRQAPALPHAVHAMDVTDADAVRGVIRETVQQFGRIDLLVNNAGMYQAGTFDLSVQEFERMLDVNLIAPFLFMQGIVPVMKKQGEGFIVNISSRAGKVGFAGDGGYVASKFGLTGLSESAYRELTSCGIRVTAICPGWTDTDMAQAANTPLAGPDMIQPSDILQTVRWLLSLSPSARVREVVMECKDSIC
jgi:NAD(P)-dependent dehydrogenase (short-subunit alcohol dehydrogenase family)